MGPDELASLLVRWGVDPWPSSIGLVSLAITSQAAAQSPDSGIDDEIAHWVHRFESSAEDKLRMELAVEHGLPYSEALERWGNPDDLAAVVAWRWLRAEEQRQKHHRCGTRASDWWDFSDPGAPVRRDDDSPYKFELLDECYACSQLYGLNKDLDAEAKARGVEWVLAPRKPGDPQIDDY